MCLTYHCSTSFTFLCSVDRSSRYNSEKKNQLDAQLIFTIFRQHLHVSGVSRPIIRRYNLCTQQLVLITLFRWLSVVLDGIHEHSQSSKKNNRYQMFLLTVFVSLVLFSSYVYLIYLMCICCTLCVFVVLCVYCCSYFRCRTAG